MQLRTHLLNTSGLLKQWKSLKSWEMDTSVQLIQSVDVTAAPMAASYDSTGADKGVKSGISRH